jgi:hypothetical protein
VICHCPNSDFSALVTKNNRLYVLYNVLKLFKTLEKDSLFAWKDPAGLAREI